MSTRPFSHSTRAPLRADAKKESFGVTSQDISTDTDESKVENGK